MRKQEVKFYKVKPLTKEQLPEFLKKLNQQLNDVLKAAPPSRLVQ